MILTGSHALAKYIDIGREPKDIDYLCSYDEYEAFVYFNESKIVHKGDTKFGHFVIMLGSKPIEFDIAEKSESSKILYDAYKGREALPLHVLYAMKMSHRYLRNSPHFLKTMNDIILMRDEGAGITSKMAEWIKLREKETYVYKHPDLTVDKVNFFVDNFYKFDHDDVHEAIKVGDAPAYQAIKIPGEDVKCSKELFDALPYEKKLLCTYEESCVLALERHQIPNNYNPDPLKSFQIALQKVCSSITSGWFREWSWENYYQVLDFYAQKGHNDYVDRLRKADDEGRLRLWDDVKQKLMNNKAA